MPNPEPQPEHGGPPERSSRRGETAEQRWRTLEALYPQLRTIAASRSAGQPPDITLQITALVHEAAVRILGAEGFEWRGEGPLLQYASTIMRRLLIDHSNRRRRDRTVREYAPQIDRDVDQLELAIGDDLAALDSALERLATFNPDGARLVELRFFGRASMAAAAAELNLPLSTAERLWREVRAFLRQELDRDA